MGDERKAAVLTISDSVSEGSAEDESGPLAAELLFGAGFEVVATDVLPDDRWVIAGKLASLSDHLGVDLVLTTGGTGVGPRDVTPEATQEVCERLLPGIAEQIRRLSVEKTPHGLLSRGLAGVRGGTLIVNLPGSPGGVRDGLGVVTSVAGHVSELVQGDRTGHIQT